MARILIIDDDEMVCRTLSKAMGRIGHDALCAHTLQDGIRQASSEGFDAVFLDVHLPDGNGLEALPTIQKSSSSPEIIIITGEGDPDGAELAIKSGAWAYVQKPLSLENLRLQLSRALQYRKEKMHTRPPLIFRRDEIIGSSPALKACLETVAQVAASDVSVLVAGETGTGKELIARAIHANSDRTAGRFVVVDCAALPETLVESMLFGHEKGAFTSAEKPRVGLIKEADGGTLFLDEIGELPLSVQKDFLRALQEHRFRPLGSREEVTSDFRLVSATNRNLEEMVQLGRFRKDLFFRLYTVSIELPPLRERGHDIKELAVHFIMKLCERYGAETKGFSSDFFAALSAYDWPGNVRELSQAIERALAVARYEPTLFPRHLPTPIRIHQARASVSGRTQPMEPSARQPHFTEGHPTLQKLREEAIARVERQYLHDLMQIANRNMKEACGLSGLSRSRLYHLLNHYGIER